jgi:hypothetical protein
VFCPLAGCFVRWFKCVSVGVCIYAVEGFRVRITPSQVKLNPQQAEQGHAQTKAWHVFQVKLRELGAFSYLQRHIGNGAEFQVHPAPPWPLKRR